MRKIPAKEIPNILEDGKPFQMFAWRGSKVMNAFPEKESEVHMMLVRRMSLQKSLIDKQ